MANDIALFGGGNMPVPAHIQNFLAENSNIEERFTVPSLSITGKVWTVSIDGKKTPLMKRNDDGDQEPVSVLRVVVLDYAKDRGRAFYEGAYNPDTISQPRCWSDDGYAPDASVSEPIAATCANCPNSAKGSKITDQGKSVVACGEHRMLAVVPAANLDHPPMRLKIAVTSDWDGNSPDLVAQGWRAFKNYTDFLRSNNVPHTAALVTKMKFDPGQAYPKILFSADRWTSEEEQAKLAVLIKSQEVADLIAGRWSPAGADGVEKTAEQGDGTAPATQQPQARRGRGRPPKNPPQTATTPQAEPEVKQAEQKPAPAPQGGDDDEADPFAATAGRPTRMEPGEAATGNVIDHPSKGNPPTAPNTAVDPALASILDDWA